MIERVLRKIGKNIPNRRYVRAIPNLVLKPVHRKLCKSAPTVTEVLGFRMELDANETVDNALFFAPQLYDADEIAFLSRVFPEGGTFVDVGSNVGFWTLRFAHQFPKSHVISIEANPVTFEILERNIRLNAFEERVVAHQLGVSDEAGEFPLYLSKSGNRGGDSFVVSASEREAVMVQALPLADVLEKTACEHVDVMKLDIEGLEGRVLGKYFDETSKSAWPTFICAETTHDPELISLFVRNGYRNVFSAAENTVFEKAR